MQFLKLHSRCLPQSCFYARLMVCQHPAADVFSTLLSDPLIQKPHLFLCMEPMLATGHDGQICVVSPCKCRYRFDGCQVIVLAIQNTGWDIPDDRMLPHIAKILPRQCFSKICGDFPFLGKCLFGHIRPLHHIADQVFHIHDRRDEKGVVHQRFIQR